ncbi:MAG: HD domain-containing protein [Planctomycetota bacterium]
MLDSFAEPDPGGVGARGSLADHAVQAWLVEPAPECLILATGGYGRGELAPRSDLDLLVVYPDGQDLSAIEDGVRLLWDAGFRVSQIVRPVGAVGDALTRDLHAATALLEARRLSGPGPAWEALLETTRRFLADHRERFLAAKFEEAEERHRAQGGAVCLVNPDLKLGRGGLRDVQLLELAARLHDPTPPAPAQLLPPVDLTLLDLDDAERLAVVSARRRLLVVRSALQRAAKSDRLEVGVQHALAAELGVQERADRLPVEVFMEDLYRALRAVDRALTRVRLSLDPGRTRAFVRARPLQDGVAVLGDELVLERPHETCAPETAAALFRLALETRRRVSLRTRDAVRRALKEWVPSAPQPLRLRALMAPAKGVATTLRDMHDAGYLGVLLPEFGALECLAQADPYHSYTVDEHTLAVLEFLEEPHPTEREELLRERLLIDVGDRDLLRLGVLLHDAGKVAGSIGHTERGLALVPGVARRLELSARHHAHVRFLVREHLTLSRLAEKRDVDSPETLATLLDVVSHDRQRLDHLYLLTCADIRGVSPQAMTRWKDYLLTRLYERAVAALEGQPDGGFLRPEDPSAWQSWLAERLPPEQHGALAAHLAAVDDDYLGSVDPDEIELHVEQAAALEAGAPAAVHASLDAHCERIWVAARDRPRLFADLCGGLSAQGYQILGVSTAYRGDGIVFDRFAVEPPPGAPQARWPRLEEGLRRAVFEGAPALPRRAPAASQAPPPAVRIRISNQISPHHTVVDVTAPDRPGLLYDLAAALAAGGCDMRLAKVFTKGNRAVDVFYVVDEAGNQLAPAACEALAARLKEVGRLPDGP